MVISQPIKNVDSSSNLTTAPQEVGDNINCSVQSTFSGTDVAGSLLIEGSNLEDPDSFVAISGATDTVASSDPSLVNITNAGYRYIRLAWTYTSGTGNITITFVSKGRLHATR
jgi:hypothetical protein